MKYLWIGLAGAAGALARYGLGLWVGGRLPLPFPLGTLLINVTGSFLLGLVAGLGSDRGLIPPAWRAPIAVGFIGAYTTFSTWTVETVRLFEAGRLDLALGNVVLSLALGLPAVWLGLVVSRRRGAPRSRR
ncbi:MAG TPA: fluoride efflux transporter CrcB [Symbiobacteriaceae bacterium]|jgi:CrcB protein